MSSSIIEEKTAESKPEETKANSEETKPESTPEPEKENEPAEPGKIPCIKTKNINLCPILDGTGSRGYLFHEFPDMF